MLKIIEEFARHNQPALWILLTWFLLIFAVIRANKSVDRSVSSALDNLEKIADRMAREEARRRRVHARLKKMQEARS